jgi:hypothetical protein
MALAWAPNKAEINPNLFDDLFQQDTSVEAESPGSCVLSGSS